MHGEWRWFSNGNYGYCKNVRRRGCKFSRYRGGATQACIKEAFKIIVSDKSVKTVLVNIFGGIVRCDLIAEGIIDAIDENSINVPIVVRLEGNHAKIGSRRLTSSRLNIISTTHLMDAVQQVVTIASERK